MLFYIFLAKDSILVHSNQIENEFNDSNSSLAIVLSDEARPTQIGKYA